MDNESNNSPPLKANEFKMDSINISHELTQTHMWQELVNSDKHINRQLDSASLKQRKQNITHKGPCADVEIPLISQHNQAPPTLKINSNTSTLN